MADTKMLPVDPAFNLEDTLSKLTKMYQTKGFEVTAIRLGQALSLKFSKDDDGIKKFAGLSLGITANFSLNENTLVVNFTDAEWTGKLIGIGVGLFLCLIPAFTAGYGAVKQSELPKTIFNDLQMLINGGTMPFGM